MSNWDIPQNLLASTHPAFREMAECIWKEHLKRRPEIDAKMNPLRLKVWQDWNEQLPTDDCRKNRQPEKLLQSGNLI